MQGIKWGGLLLIYSFGSRHYSGVMTLRATVCKAGVPVCTTEGLRVHARACLGRPITTGLLGCSVATESFLSR